MPTLDPSRWPVNYMYRQIHEENSRIPTFKQTLYRYFSGRGKYEKP